MSHRIAKPFSVALGTAFSLGLAGAVQADQNPFSATEFEPLRVAEAAQGQCGEAKCGAGKQPAKAAEATCGAKEKAAAEATCGAGKKAAKPKPIREASCGEAKCGANK